MKKQIQYLVILIIALVALCAIVYSATLKFQASNTQNTPNPTPTPTPTFPRIKTTSIIPSTRESPTRGNYLVYYAYEWKINSTLMENYEYRNMYKNKIGDGTFLGIEPDYYNVDFSNRWTIILLSEPASSDVKSEISNLDDSLGWINYQWKFYEKSTYHPLSNPHRSYFYDFKIPVYGQVVEWE